jgi:hypothetical protein
MTTRLKYGRAGALAVIGGALSLLTATAPARAQVSSCVGDCGNNNEVTIANLILGVSIALGNTPASACPAFQNAQGMVDIAQLIKGVNNALTGCPVLPTPTSTGTPVGTSTATSTATVTATATATPTTPPLGDTPTASPTATGSPVTPPIGAHTCTFLKSCSGGTCSVTTSMLCTSDLDCPQTPTKETCTHPGCTSDAECMPDKGTCSGNVNSGVALYAAAFPVPLSFGLGGTAKIDCGTPDETGKTQCTCDIATADPISIPSVGFVCIMPAPTPCPSNDLYCDGGPPVGLSVRSDGNIGACTSNAACETACDAHCAAINSERVSAGCTGFCTAGSMKTCNLDKDCLPDDGACNGPDPVGTKNDICQCGCANASAGDPSRPGDFKCNLGANLVVEAHAPCDGTDVTINVGSACIPLTTGDASTLITHANFTEAGTVPGAGGPAEAVGQPVTCENLRTDHLSGLQIRGAVNFFGSTLGDLATSLATFCK